MLSKQDKYENVKYVFYNIIPLLLLAQFDLLLTHSYAISSIIILVLAIIFILKNYFSQSMFVVIIIMYISSYFKLFSTIGHSFALMFFIVFLARKINRKPTREIQVKDNSFNLLFFILILFNILGWTFKSQLEPRYFSTSIIMFFSLLFLFHTSSGLIWTKKRVLLFLNITIIIISYALLTAIINPLKIMPFKSALWNSYDVDYVGIGTVFVSMIERPSTAIGAMLFGLFLGWTLNTNRLSLDRKTRNNIIIGLVFSFILCISGFSKSHSIVLVSMLVIVPIFNSLVFKTNIIKGNIKVFPYIILLISFIIITNNFFNYKYLFIRFEQQSGFVDNFLENPLLPEETSREQSFSMGQESLKRENWMIGYGYANGSRNRRAWLGENHKNIKKKDFHNLYYSLPQIFGWSGSVAYLLLFFVTMFRLSIVARERKNSNIFRIFALSLLIYFIAHLITEYSITSLSSPHYLMMLFIIMGLSNALYHNHRKLLLLKHET
jgi:hypothetical protein